jgi:tetratricopeptide (TPR) repeat protein
MLEWNIRRTLTILVIGLAAGSAGAQSHSFTNLKVLPKDIPPAELRALMNSFTRALGVRCIYCHVGEEGKPFQAEDFAKDEKVTKRKAREMIQMVHDINENYLAKIESRASPPIRVECATCHRGATQPRTLQEVLRAAYDTLGVDSTMARYQALRSRFYGRAVFDFGEVPLSDVANHAQESGHPQDATRLLALNVGMNPQSMFAKRQYAERSILNGFALAPDSGAAAYHAMTTLYGSTIANENMLNEVGYELLAENRNEAAIAAFRLNASEHPTSGNTYDSLGEAYAKQGDRKHAIEAYSKSLELDPKNDNARQKLVELKAPSKKR